MFKGGLVIEDGVITDIFDENEALPGCECLDAHGDFLTPGFIDIHTHGAGGADFMDGEPGTYAAACGMQLRHGVTAVCPTTTASGNEDLETALSSFEQALKLPGLPELIGLHLEGPYFSASQRGAQPLNKLRPPSTEEYLPRVERSAYINRWSLAPELPGAMAMGLTLRQRGIVAAIAHTDALATDVRRASDYGFTLLTHFYSGMSTVHRENGYRFAGVIEAGYLMDDLTVEVIADGHHLPPELLQLIYKLKGSSRICLITDSMRGAGMPEGQYYLGKKGTGEKAFVEGGVAKTPDRQSFAGSVATADILLRTMVEKGQAPLPEAVRMLTLTPARVMGVDSRMGSLAIGKAANLLLLDSELNVKTVYLRGNKISIVQ
jgi:N-acetylglucosamine-6-phosphate deacetylase